MFAEVIGFDLIGHIYLGLNKQKILKAFIPVINKLHVMLTPVNSIKSMVHSVIKLKSLLYIDILLTFLKL